MTNEIEQIVWSKPYPRIRYSLYEIVYFSQSKIEAWIEINHYNILDSPILKKYV